MENRPTDTIKALIMKDMLNIHNRQLEIKKLINDNLHDTLSYFTDLIIQIAQSNNGPLITKTPKILRKKGAQRIETIPEDDVINIDTVISDSIAIHDKTDVKDVKKEDQVEAAAGRSKRKASRKAADNIKIQQSLTLTTKLRRPSNLYEGNDTMKKRESRAKRKKSARSSSDEDTAQIPPKLSKTDASVSNEYIPKQVAEVNLHNQVEKDKEETLREEDDRAVRKRSRTKTNSSRMKSFTRNSELINKKSNIADETVIAPRGNDVEEASIYEDAIGKQPTPIMNSTMNIHSPFVMQKIMNATVVLESLPTRKLNETVTINGLHGNNIQNTVQKNLRHQSDKWNDEFKAPGSSKPEISPSKTLQDRTKLLKDAMANKEFDDLLTEDESSPEKNKTKPKKKQENRTRQKRAVTSASSSESEIFNTPPKMTLKERNAAAAALKDGRNLYKSNALFSPYAKESVKKRVEAFEQVGMNSPKPAVEIDAPTRITRTKTRAIAAAAQAEATETVRTADKTVAHKLANKSLAKAKKISLARQVKDLDETKENKVAVSTQKLNKPVAMEKLNNKQQQMKTTPMSKIKTQLPMSVNRIQQTPSNLININHTKALSATRGNIVTSMESFIQAPKSVSKRNSIDKLEEKKRKLNDEDARKKREEALRLQTEEKRRKRQEKELKNKLAREAKERQELEKRHRIEREREEKARLAQQMQEKQREEMDRKRLAQLQRAQEKEERRKLEEQQRLNRLQEQEEAERLLAEQKRREHEAEKRREADLRAQQQAAAEAMKAKNQMLMAQGKYESKHHGPTNYILESEPDEDESDDESRPKHTIPYWAQSQVRKAQLAMQRYIPDKVIYKFFGSKKCTPDLTELFQGIDRSRLKRTSSAIWTTPPRYSMMEDE